jgi:hypothetical protein
MTKKYHLEVWLGDLRDVSQLELRFFPKESPVEYNAIELVDIRHPSAVIHNNRNVLIDGLPVPHRWSFDVDSFRAGFFVRDGVTVDDFEVTIILP